jgi:hypothetical protein
LGSLGHGSFICPVLHILVLAVYHPNKILLKCALKFVGGYFDDMLLRLNWRSLEDRHKDAQLAMMYKIANERVFFY